MCGKIFKNTALANFHAEKSGHDQFEESTEDVKPLTDEEKKQKLQELREKLAAKRAVKSVAETQEQKSNEIIRRKAGKARRLRSIHPRRCSCDLAGRGPDQAGPAAQGGREGGRGAQARCVRPLTDHAPLTTSAEKLEDAKARAAVKAQIEADKQARAERAAREKAVRDGKVVAESAPVTVAAPAAAAASSGRDYKETRLQIRMAAAGAGGPYTTALPSESSACAIARGGAGRG